MLGEASQAITEVTAGGRVLIFPFVMNRPVDLPGFAIVGRGFPAPVEFGRRDVLEYHALQRSRAVFAGHLALQNHLAVFEVADKIEIAALIVDPRLLPMAGTHVENRNAGAVQFRSIQGREIFLHDAIVQNALDAVRAMSGFAGVLPGPGKVPVAHPKIELFLLRCGAGIWRRRVLCIQTGSQKKECSERTNLCRSHELSSPQVLSSKTLACVKR
jgi:hypothetical protein